jgi:hypothetical protein
LRNSLKVIIVKQHGDAVFSGVDIGFNVGGTVLQGFFKCGNRVFVNVIAMLTQATVGE